MADSLKEKSPTFRVEVVLDLEPTFDTAIDPAVFEYHPEPLRRFRPM